MDNAVVAKLYHAVQFGDRRMEGIEKRQFRLAAEIVVNSGGDPYEALEAIWEQTQSLHGPWPKTCPPSIRPAPGLGLRSTCVGDVVVMDGSAYFCAPMGWSAFTPPAGGLKIAEPGKSYRMLPAAIGVHASGVLAVPVDAEWIDSAERALRCVRAGTQEAPIAIRGVVWIREDLTRECGQWIYDDDVLRLNELATRVSDLGVSYDATLRMDAEHAWLEVGLTSGLTCRSTVATDVVTEMARRVERRAAASLDAREELHADMGSSEEMPAPGA